MNNLKKVGSLQIKLAHEDERKMDATNVDLGKTN